MKREVTQEELRVVEVMMRLQPELFWYVDNSYGIVHRWCGAHLHKSHPFPQCSRLPGHEGPHVACAPTRDGITLFHNSKPWYEDEDAY